MTELTFTQLAQANVVRNEEWVSEGTLSLSFRGVELAGEVGEACNIIKKIEREKIGLRGSRATKEELAEELADIIICTDLIAMDMNIDLEAAVRDKFNKTSDKLKLRTKI